MEININLAEFKRFQESLTQENAIEKLKNYEFPFDIVLPINIGGVQVEKPSWNNFQGTPDPKNEYYLAYIYWGINYFYDTTKNFSEEEKKMQFTVSSLTAQPKIKPNSWARYKCKKLLHHETGHYIIACLCALEFKKRVMEKNVEFYTSQHAKEITAIFNSTMKEFCQFERQYDNETNHYLIEEKQIEWNLLLIQKLLAYKKYFPVDSLPDSKIILAQIQGKKNNIDQYSSCCNTKSSQINNTTRIALTNKKIQKQNIPDTKNNDIKSQTPAHTAIEIDSKGNHFNQNQRVLKQPKEYQPAQYTAVNHSSTFKLSTKEFSYSSIPVQGQVLKQSNSPSFAKLLLPQNSSFSTQTSLQTTSTTFTGYRKMNLVSSSNTSSKLKLPSIEKPKIRISNIMKPKIQNFPPS